MKDVQLIAEILKPQEREHETLVDTWSPHENRW